MALTNFTEDEKYQKTTVEVFCSPELISGVDGELIFLSALTIFMSIAAFLGNTMILVALHKETSLHPPSKLLYRNLATSRLVVAGTQIQTSCNFETNACSCNWFIDYLHCRSFYNLLEYSYDFMVLKHRYSSVYSHRNLRLHKNFSLSGVIIKFVFRTMLLKDNRAKKFH